jgi:predicted MPP superfamily phosphohydrolase
MINRSANRFFGVTQYEYASPLVPPAFDGFKIAQVSDLHNRRFPDGPEVLADALRAERPGLIAVTGDLIDRQGPVIETAIDFIRLAVGIAPVYYVAGNHEYRSGVYHTLLPRLREAGVRVLEDAWAAVEKDGERFVIAGLRDPAYATDHSGRTDAATLSEREAALRRLLPAGDTLAVLLSHRPELFDLYARCGVPLVLTGHAHGGQVRLPGIGGLYAPGQGLFPRYTCGIYRRDNTVMVVSRGLGGRLVHLRVRNKPELVVVKLQHQPPLSS